MGLGPEQDAESLPTCDLKMVHAEGRRIAAIGLDEGEVVMTFDPESYEAECCSPNEADTVGPVVLEMNGSKFAGWRFQHPVHLPFAIDQDIGGLPTPDKRGAQETCRYVCIGPVEDILKKNDNFIIVLIRYGPGIFHNQRPCCGNSLKPDMGVVEVRSSHPHFRTNLVIEEVLWRDRPLTCKRCAIGKGGYGHAETVPMLDLLVG